MSHNIIPHDAKIYVAGHRGLVGSSIVRRLEKEGYTNIVVRTHDDLDLTDQRAVKAFFEDEKPENVFLCAAKVGGILANDTYPAEFIYENLAIQQNIIHESWRCGVRRLIFLGSSCIYPRGCQQPMKEECLLTGTLEKTNRPYAIAKIAGIEMCWAYNRQYSTKFLAAMPTNLYGLNDSYHPENSHVLPALLRRFHEAKESGSPSVTCWGTGAVRREFLYSDDVADALFMLFSLDDDAYDSLVSSEEIPPLINIGCGEDMTIKELAEAIADAVDYRGEILWNTSRPDGTPQKLLDITKIKSLGWSSTTSLKEGLKKSYADMQKNALQ